MIATMHKFNKTGIMPQEFVEETARAWRIHPKKVAELADWTERKVNPDYRAVVFANMLRRYMGTHDSNASKPLTQDIK